MSNITINAKARTIELTKSFAAASSKFGSSEYQELQAARRDYPNFRVVTVAQKTAKPKFKGLDYEYMENYIAKHDNEDKTIMKTFLGMRGIGDTDEQKVMQAESYGVIKKWFLEQYPVFDNTIKARKEQLKQAAEKREKQAAEKKAEKLVALSA